MPTKEIQDIKLDVQKNKLDIENIMDRMDSYHFDHKTKLEKVEAKIDSLPSEDRIFRMFKEEGEKLAKGLIKQIDEVKSETKISSDKIEILEKQREKDAGFIAGAKWLLGLIITGLAAIGIKISV